MLKRPITYTDFDGEKHTENFYFSLDKAELIQLQLKGGKAGYAEMLQDLVSRQDGEEIVETFKRIILMAYGEKDADGKHFWKKDPATGRPLSERFEQHAAFSELFTELATVTESAIEFVNGIAPPDLDTDKRLQPQDHLQKKGQPVKGEVVADLPTATPDADPAEPVETTVAAPEKPLSEYTAEELEAHLEGLRKPE